LLTVYDHDLANIPLQDLAWHVNGVDSGFFDINDSVLDKVFLQHLLTSQLIIDIQHVSHLII
jgi:hypothetical protein